MNKLMGAFIRNNVFATALTIVLIVGGAVALKMMVREFFPEISIDHILVDVPYPGADPEEVEEGISRKIEESLDTVEGIKRYTTVSAENFSHAFIEVAENYDSSSVYDKVRNAVDSISTFPVDAEKPIISELVFRHEVVVVALSGEFPERTLKEWAEEIKDELQRLPYVSQVAVLGTRDYEVGIEVSEARLREYGLTFSQVASAVRRGSLNLAGGVLRTTGEEIRLRTVGRKYTAEDFAKIVLLARPSGEIITLDRIADIRDEFTEDPVYGEFNGQRAVMVGVFKTKEEDAIAIAEEVRQYAAEKQLELPEGAGISLWADNAYLIQDRLNMLRRNGIQGLIIVIILLFLLLDARLSFWVSMGIPISFGGALAVMYMHGDTLNMISLFGLIMVLGMLVDDAIVVGEAIHYHRMNGLKPFDAALKGVTEVALPVLGAVTTTIIAFMPLMFVGGIMGKFIRIVPIAVIACLAISLFESLFLLPAHLNRLPELVRHPANHRPHPLLRFRWAFSNAMDWFIVRVYAPFLDRTLRHRYIALAAAAAVTLITLGLFTGGFIKFETFSEVDGNDLSASVEFPAGTPISVTENAVARLRDALERVAEKTKTSSGKPLLANVYAVSGQSGDGFEQKTGSNRGQVRTELLRTEERGIHSEEIKIMWEREVSAIPGALSLTFAGISAGPPGAPIEVWLQGEDMSVLLAGSAEIKEKLKTYDGVYQIQDDYRPGKTEVRLNLKPEARTLGLMLEDLARQVFAGYYGEEAVRIQRGRDDVRVRVRYTEGERRQLAEFERIRIRTPLGMEVPLLSVADVEYGEGYSSITRINGLRRVAVTAEIDTTKANAEEVLADLDSGFLPDLQKRLGFIYSFEGAQTESREALDSLKIGFPMALFVIFVIIATIFRSYLQPVVIMFSVPFGLMGAVYGHLMFGLTVTLMSLFGMVALAGVVVNDAIVLVDHLNTTLRSKVPFYDALRKSGMRRFRAIFLTSATTVGGLSMLILSRDMQAQWLKPMAVSLAVGLIFSTVLTLVFLPVLLALFNDLRRGAHYVIHGRLPLPEEVEPACCEAPANDFSSGAVIEGK
ncbi:MAG TPA: efflux RND transporter permease subunit [Candidatus Bathyarchaeia archaeon]|nr:efflux RND transporter permease subunit [Candidatus Bathyarchaeia archaeon]